MSKYILYMSKLQDRQNSKKKVQSEETKLASDPD
jgi:hypothetical protein